MEKVTKSIRIDPKLWRRARVRALGEGRTIQDLVADSLRKYLADKKAGRKGGASIGRGEIFDSSTALKLVRKRTRDPAAQE